MPAMKNDKLIGVLVNADTDKAIRQLAADQRRSISQVVRIILESSVFSQQPMQPDKPRRKGK